LSLATFPSAYVFGSQAAAVECQQAVDTALGMPIAGTDIGGGVHVPADASITVTYAVPLQNPSTGLWAYLADGVTQPLLAPSAAVLGLPAPVALDATWYAAGDGGIVEAGAQDSGVQTADSGALDSGGHAVVVITKTERR
jgi:hypothetical protein